MITALEILDALARTPAPRDAPLTAADYALAYGPFFVPLAALAIAAWVFAALWAREKRRARAERQLCGAYAPLYEYLARQELHRMLASGPSREEAPVAEGEGVGRQAFLKALLSVDKGFAPQKLLTLMGMYQTLLAVEAENDPLSDPAISAAVLLADVERAILSETVAGYLRLQKKAGRKPAEKNPFFQATKQGLTYKNAVTLQAFDAAKHKREVALLVKSQGNSANIR